ncbi:TetR/AcrR family transcriptional regulator C-terminal domain-containing protein [Nocardioides zeae]|uniref:TetR/AcrR family transcriptional regulator n=1 Tax=Nocardioides zeae TaxID=1457234 RepID=A0A6P0HNR4_9ACTN|nr:TetR/AcrR family transcriptional regulator C-terminal domain-containing protein [Nocardioides zeae]NEN80246.1 TetR/AcrR family transcriptional regulator [Nocardioides zeae]
MAPSRSTRSTRRVTHSREQIVETATAILDAEGIKGLTLRGLAAELGGGLGSIYWHVAGKEQLVELACDELVGRALAAAESGDAGDAGDDVPSPPLEVDLGTRDPAVVEAALQVRRIALALFGQMERHPWLAGQVELSGGQPNGLRVWEAMGRPLAAMGLTRRQQFHGSTALLGYVVGVAAQMSSQDAIIDPALDADEQLELVVARWQDLDADEFPWIRSMADEFRRHEDLEQFAAGLDLLVLGLVRQVPEER